MTREKKIPSKFKIFLVTNNINQTELSNASSLGITTLHHLINDGIFTKSTIAKVTNCLNEKFNKNISFEQLTEMVIK